MVNDQTEYEVKVRVHQGSVLSLLLFAVLIEKITKDLRKINVNELQYSDDLMLFEDS